MGVVLSVVGVVLLASVVPPAIVGLGMFRNVSEPCGANEGILSALDEVRRRQVGEQTASEAAASFEGAAQATAIHSKFDRRMFNGALADKTERAASEMRTVAAELRVGGDVDAPVARLASIADDVGCPRHRSERQFRP